MKYIFRKKLTIIVILNILLCSLLTFATVVNADTTSQNQINELLEKYELAVSNPSAISSSSFTSQMWDLIKDRRAYYEEFFNTGLHSSLTEIESEFDNQTLVIGDGGKVSVIEYLSLTGKPLLQDPKDYPIYQGTLWAISQVSDPDTKSQLIEYSEEILQQVQSSIDERIFTITWINEHELQFDLQSGLIISDEYSSESRDDPGNDQVIWNDKGPRRIEVDLHLFPDYQMYVTPIENIGTDILNIFGQNNEAVIHNPESIRYSYSGTSAASYINTYVRNTTSRCQTVPFIVLQDESVWNPAYPPWYCADCANYVSQALKYGGLPTDGVWYIGSGAWLRVGELQSWITGTGKGGTTACVNLIAGDVGIQPNTHTVMVGAINPIRYSAHTSDRRLASWSYYLTTCIHIY